MGSSAKPHRSRSRAPNGAAGPASTRIRWSKVLAARRRLARGYYERDEVWAAVVDALWKELQRS
jgi:hypothetical protein